MTTEQLPKKQIFHCGNLTLAIALEAAGCSWANDGERGICGLNKYSIAFIRSHSEYEKMKGMSHDDAIKHLWRNGQPGNIVYCFERSPVLSAVCEGWDKQAVKNDEKPPPEVLIDAETLGAVAYKLAKAREKLVGSKEKKPLWREKDKDGNLFVPAIAHTTGTSSAEATGDYSSRTVIRDAQMRGVQV